MRVVVTGALGHIGSRLVRELPRALSGVEVIAMDDLSTGRLSSLPAAMRRAFVEADVLSADLDRHFAGATAVLHLAAVTDAAGSFAIADHVARVNVEGTRRVAEACIASGATLFFPSTTSVYGTQAEEVDESCALLRPQSPYAESKLACERMLRDLASRSALRHVVCRFGTIFGVSPGMRFHTAVNKFCLQAAQGIPLTVWRGAFRQHRPYLDLDDAARAIALILQRGLFDGQTYNVLTLNATTEEVTHAIAAHCPGLRLEFVDSPLLNQHSYRVVAKRFSGEGFETRGDLPRAIGETLQWIAATQRSEARA